MCYENLYLRDKRLAEHSAFIGDWMSFKQQKPVWKTNFVVFTIWRKNDSPEWNIECCVGLRNDFNSLAAVKQRNKLLLTFYQARLCTEENHIIHKMSYD